nr:TonB-dependent siderophore receptor [Allomuricauda sp.]
MKTKITFLLLAIATVSAFAQDRKKFTLLDSETKLPVVSANVLNQASSIGTTSDSDGKFQITGNPSDSIIISHINYTKIVYSFQDMPDIIYIDANQTRLNEVAVTAQRERVAALNKIPIKNIDLPATTNAISAKILEQRNPTDLGDAVKSATGVRPINRYGGFQTFRIRGFNNFVLLVDGVRDERHNLSTSAPSTNLANVERIEVLKGPASVLFGHSALGGIINIVRKKPSSIQTGNFNATYGSFDTYNMAAGIGGPISEKLKYRVDFGTTRSNGWRDYGVVTNNGSLMLDYELSDKDRIEVYLQANNDQYDTDTGIPVDDDGSLVDGMNPETRYNDPQDFLKHKRFDVQLKYHRRLNDRLHLTNHFAWSDDDINYLSTEFLEFNEARDSITRAFPFYFNHTTSTIQNQLDLSYNFETGNVEHKSLVGYNISILDRKSYRGNVVGPGTFTTIAVQNPILNQGHIEVIDTRVNVREELVNAFYLQDWMKFSNKLKALVGIRYDIFSGTYYTDELNPDRSLSTAGEQTSIPSTALTYRAGIVYQPMETTSLFASYSNYFKPSRTITPDGQVFDPERGYQAELGVKWEKLNLISATLSGFYMLKNNIVERNTVNEFNQIGEADSKGVEVDIEYTPIKELYIKAGYAYADARVRAFDEASLQATRAGNKLRFAPEHLLNGWASYEFKEGKIKGFGFGSGINFTGANYTDSANTFELPSYYTWDTTVFYNTGKGIRIAFNLNNITDQLYYTDAIYGNQFFPGMERNFKLSLGYSF